MQNQNQIKILIIGGGLAGLTAARTILDTVTSKCNVTILQSLDRVGGRTQTVQHQGFVFDLGAQYIGKTQKYALQLAEQSGNLTYLQQHKGKKILDFDNSPSQYHSDIPYKVGILGLIQMQWNLIKIDKMAKKVLKDNPSNCQLACQWDHMTVADWLRKNIWSEKVKRLIQLSIRAVYAVEISEISMLLFLWYVNQNGGLQNIINVQNGLQQEKLKKGSQHMSEFLQQKIQEKGGKIIFNTKVNKVIQNQKQKQIKAISLQGQEYLCDYLIVSCPPVQVNKIHFQPQLSTQRRYLCNKNFMGLSMKFIILYKQRYWLQKNYSGQILTDGKSCPLFCSYDATKTKQNGQVQPAIFTFINAGLYQEWSRKSRKQIQNSVLKKLSQYFKCEQMLNPMKVLCFPWHQENSIGGGYTALYSPGTLTNMSSFCIRQPQGRIHWAGTQTALESTGYMDGAIQSGIRVAKQIKNRLSEQNKAMVEINENTNQSLDEQQYLNSFHNKKAKTNENKTTNVQWYKGFQKKVSKYFQWI